MKALIKNEEAQAGVGTLIIFIAMVLVAAVAAAVLIQTSGTMQSKSTSTTKEAASAISENVVVESVDGVATAAGTLNTINITVRLASGSSDVDLSKLLVKVNSVPYGYSPNLSAFLSSSTNFTVYSLRDPSNGLNTSVNQWTNTPVSSPPVLKSGALARLDITGLSLASKASVPIALTPEKGTTFNLPLTLPAIAAGSNSIYP